MIEMSELEKLRKEYELKVENLQKNCKHEEFSPWKHVKNFSNELYRTCLKCGFKEKDVIHKWKCVGRTPSGGLAGGDDLYECRRCGIVTDDLYAKQRWAYEPCEQKEESS